jgi:tRNA threonylcarbamoyladenosine biosynthesis protein TsaB
MIARLHWPDVREIRCHRDRRAYAPGRVRMGSAPVRFLAIDCATERLALAAVDDGRRPADGRAHGAAHAHLARAACRIETLDLAGGVSASAQALPALLRLMEGLGWTFADIDAIAFGAGPGGFTGLRTACAVAQGLAFGQGLPVVPVDSLAIVADDAARQLGDVMPAGAPIWVLMDARMDEIYAGCYADGNGGGWRTVVAPALTTPDDLNELWLENPPQAVTGSALTVFGDRLVCGDALRVPIERARAESLGWLAAAGFARGDAVAADRALPVYLRDKVALTTAEREAVRARRDAAQEGAPE